MWGKGKATLPVDMLEESIRALLICNQPRDFTAGQRRSQCADHLALFQTIADCAGMYRTAQCRSLVRWTQPVALSERVYCPALLAGDAVRRIWRFTGGTYTAIQTRASTWISGAMNWADLSLTSLTIWRRPAKSVTRLLFSTMGALLSKVQRKRSSRIRSNLIIS